MKVVLFCGGLGTRLREHSNTIPKPLVDIGGRPILWHLMKYYAYYGHKDFILCLGYKGEMIKEFFLSYNPYLTQDFTMSMGGNNLVPEQSDIHDWNISFVDTGLHTNIGQRLNAVKDYLKDEEVFLANYSDQLSDLPLDEYLNTFLKSNKTAALLGVKPVQKSFHMISIGNEDTVMEIQPVNQLDFWINGGYFALRREIFDYLREGEELVEEPLDRLIAEKKLLAYRYAGFWACMDTFKDKITFDRMNGGGHTPWAVWKKPK